MPIQNSDIKFFKSETVNEAGSNGGSIGPQLPAGVTQSLYPVLTQSQRANGLVTYRKAFCGPYHTTNEGKLLSTQVGTLYPTPAGDRIYLMMFDMGKSPSDFESTQNDVINANPALRYYGAGQLAESVTAGATSIKVSLEDRSEQPIKAGDELYITDKQDVSSTQGKEERITVQTVTDDTEDDSVIVITTATGLANEWLVSPETPITVSSLLNVGEVKSRAEMISQPTSEPFDINDVTVPNSGSIFQKITLSFTSTTGFNVESDVIGSMGTGVKGSAFTYNNPNTGTPYFTIEDTAFPGSFTTGDLVQFYTIPIVFTWWEKRIVPAGTEGSTGNKRTVFYITELGA